MCTERSSLPSDPAKPSAHGQQQIDEVATGSGTPQQTERGENAPGFDIARVNAALAGSAFQGRVHHFAVVSSTQTLAIADAQAETGAWRAYVADEQTAGRGRGGHTWHSEPENGLYMTALVRPALRGHQALLVSLAAALAARSAIADVTGMCVDLRWPNDVVTMGPGSLKLGGILTEAAMQPDGRMRYAAIGIGVNLNQQWMPQELRSSSTSLRQLTGAPVSRELLLTAVLRRLEGELYSLADSAERVLERFAASSTWVHGKRVHVAEDEGYTGLTVGLSEAGLLRVQCDNGTVRLVRHGGVREMP